MTNTIATPSAGIRDIDALLAGTQWDAALLTFAFPESATDYEADYPNGEPLDNFEPFNDAQRSAVRTVLGQIADVTELGFSEATGAEAGQAELRFAMTDATATAHAYYPSLHPAGGDSWYNNVEGQYDAPALGNYAWFTLLHEIGHALGLRHGHEADGLSAGHDSTEFSVMTYRSYVGAELNGYTNETWGFAQSLMMYDIAALQHMYGADFGTRSDSTVYSWDPATGEMFVNGVGQGAPGGNRVFLTVWDGGGTDSYDLSAYAGGVSIDLRPGQWTTTADTQLANLGFGHMARGNIANALLHRGDTRSLIENAEGGAGDDTIVGNQASNALFGGGGQDDLRGLSGGDHLVGADGGDALDGGAGNDALHGEAGDDLVSGGGGWDRLFGSDGADRLDGGWGGDRMFAGGGTDTGIGGIGSDLIDGREGNDRLLGDEGWDKLRGGARHDELSGGDGHDRLHGGPGRDAFHFDTALGAGNVDTILDFETADTIHLDRNVFTGLAADGALDASAFVAGAAATDADDRVLYDAATGDLSYDPDGSGAETALLFARLAPGTALDPLDLIAYTG